MVDLSELHGTDKRYGAIKHASPSGNRMAVPAGVSN